MIIVIGVGIISIEDSNKDLATFIEEDLICKTINVKLCEDKEDL